MGKGERPEHANPPDIFYNEDEARKYTSNSRMIAIQEALTQRALELLALPDEGPKLLLDLGCGSGLSGEELTENGHTWVGFDISQSMLDVAVDREVEGDLCLLDMGHGMPLRAGVFDGAISISAIQWLCNADSKQADPRKRMRRFFESLYASLTKGARAVLQMYPENTDQAQMLTSAAMKAGFSGGLVVDFPHSTRAKKYFLVLMVGSTTVVPVAKGLNGEEEYEADEVRVSARRTGGKKQKTGSFSTMSSRHPDAKGKAWIFRKKDKMRKQGYANIPADTKYTGRKRKSHF